MTHNVPWWTCVFIHCVGKRAIISDPDVDEVDELEQLLRETALEVMNSIHGRRSKRESLPRHFEYFQRCLCIHASLGEPKMRKATKQLKRQCLLNMLKMIGRCCQSNLADVGLVQKSKVPVDKDLFPECESSGN